MLRARSRSSRALTLTLSAIFGTALASASLAIEEGQRAPGFSAPHLTAKAPPVNLSDYRGKVVYLDFWASWCPPCLTSLPLLNELQREFPDDRFQVLAINVDNDLGKARKFLRKRPVDYPSASAPKGRIPESYGLKTMPTSYLIDEDGVVRMVHAGFRTEDLPKLREEIGKLVGAPAKAASR